MVENQRPVRWHSELALLSEDIVNGLKGNFDSLLCWDCNLQPILN